LRKVPAVEKRDREKRLRLEKFSLSRDFSAFRRREDEFGRGKNCGEKEDERFEKKKKKETYRRRSSFQGGNRERGEKGHALSLKRGVPSGEEVAICTVLPKRRPFSGERGSAIVGGKKKNAGFVKKNVGLSKEGGWRGKKHSALKGTRTGGK